MLRWARIFIPAILIGCASVSHAAQSQSQSWPVKPVRLVVPFAPGGTTDILGRMVAAGIAQEIGQPVIVENLAGANGNIGAGHVAASPADGYTLMLGTPGPMIVNQYVYDNLRYNPKTAFEPIVTVAALPNVLMVRPSLDVDSPMALVKALKQPAHRLSHGSPGVGSSGHVSTELFKMLAGVEAVHVPYNGSVPMLTDLIGGITDFTIDQISPSLKLIQSGKLKALAVTSAERSPALPEVPTLAEAGFPAYEVSVWFCVAAPAGTPTDIVNKVNAAVNKTLQDPSVIAQLQGYGATPVGGTPEELRALINKEESTIKRVSERTALKGQ